MRDITMKKPIEQDSNIHDLRRNDRIQHVPASEGNIYDKQQIAWTNKLSLILLIIMAREHESRGIGNPQTPDIVIYT